MSGTKTITNTSSVPVSVVLRGRIGAEPSGGSLPPVAANIGPNMSVTLQYGSDQNPYLNSIQVEERASGSDIVQTFACLQRGGPGTLDNLFNANSTLVVAYNPVNYSFALSGHN